MEIPDWNPDWGVRITDQLPPDLRRSALTSIWPKLLTDDSPACVPAGVVSRICVLVAGICEAGAVQPTDSMRPSKSVVIPVSGANSNGTWALTMPGSASTDAFA